MQTEGEMTHGYVQRLKQHFNHIQTLQTVEAGIMGGAVATSIVGHYTPLWCGVLGVCVAAALRLGDPTGLDRQIANATLAITATYTVAVLGWEIANTSLWTRSVMVWPWLGALYCVQRQRKKAEDQEPLPDDKLDSNSSRSRDWR